MDRCAMVKAHSRDSSVEMPFDSSANYISRRSHLLRQCSRWHLAMLLHSSFFSPSSGVSTSCAESPPPPMQLPHLDHCCSASLGSPPAFVLTDTSFEVTFGSMDHSLLRVLYFKVHSWLSTSQSSFLVLHLEVHRHSWYFTRKYSPF